MTTAQQRRGVSGPPLLPPIVGIGLFLATAVLSVLLSASETAAQSTPPQVQGLSAEQFLKRVSQSNPWLTITEAEVDAAAARVSAAGLWANPSIAYDREEVFEAGRGLPENYLRLELPLEISGRRSLRVDSAEQGLKAARCDVVAARVAILADSIHVYLRAAAWRQRVRILQDSRAALARLRDSVRARTSAGDASGYDLARIEIEVSPLDDLISDADRELVKARLLIGMLLGQPGVQFDPTDDLTTGTVSALSSEQAVARSQPNVVAARHRVTQQGLNRDAAGRGWVPSLTLSGGAKTAPLVGDTAWGYLAGVTLTLPIFDFGQADKERANAELRRAQANLATTEHQIATDIVIARDAFERAKKQLETYERDQLPRLGKLMTTAEVSYKEGERLVFELLDAHRTAREVRIRHIDLKLQARLSRIELLKALGREPGGDQ